MKTDHAGGDWLDDVYITANKNAIPNDPEKPFVTSGVRLGTPAVTTRGMKEPEMDKIAEFISVAASDRYEKETETLRTEVKELCGRFPIYE